MTGASNGQINDASAPFATGGSGGVTSLNAETGDIILVAGSNVTITPAGQNITISSSGGGGGSPGGTNGQIQYNNATAFGGDTATTDGSGNWSATSLNLSGLTASELAATDSSKNLQSLTTATYPSLTEISYVKGVTSAIQTQLNSKGAGTVTAVSVASANGFSGSSSGGATPALTIVAGAITPTSVNSVVLSGSSTPTLAVTGTTTVSGSNTGDQTITLTGGVTGSGTGSFAATVVTNANLTGPITSVGNATTVANNINLPGSPTTTTQTALTNNTTVATTAYTDGAVATAIAGVNPAVAVQAATTSSANTSSYTYLNGVSGVGATLTGVANTALVIDGFTFTTTGQRLLVKNDTQTTGGASSGAFNGIYFVSQIQTLTLPVILIRALDYDQASDINNTGAIPVINGTVNGTTTWIQTAQIVNVGTDALVFVQFSYNPSSIVTTFSAGSTGLTPSSATSGAVTLAGTLAVGNGGTGNTSGTATVNANLTGPVTSSGNATTLITSIPFSAGSTTAVGNQTFYLVAKSAFAGTINTLLAAQTTSGTITAAVKINGINVTGLSAVSITSTPGDTTASGANTFAISDVITLATSSASSDLGLSFNLKITRA